MLMASVAPSQSPILGGAVSSHNFGFPIESDEILLSTLNKIGIHDVRDYDLKKPSQQVALACFTAFLELLSYVNEDVVEMLKGDCLSKNDHRELYEESLHIVIRFREIRALMIASCVSDFCLPDILRPKPKRFKKQMFALINFLRFSEHHIQYFDRLKEEADHKIRARSELSERISDRTARLSELSHIRKSEEDSVSQHRTSNAALGDKLRALKEEQGRLLNELEDAKQDKNVMHSRLIKLIETSRLLHEELTRLKLRMENTPLELKLMIQRQTTLLLEKRNQLVEEESKAQSMFSKRIVLDELESAIFSVSSIVEDCLMEQLRLERGIDELALLEGTMKDVARERDDLTIERDQRKEKLKWAHDRLERLQSSVESKRDQNRVRKEESKSAWQATQSRRLQRQEKVESLAQELSVLLTKYEKISESFDAFHDNTLKQKGQLEAQCNEYIKAVICTTNIQIDL